MPFFSVSTNIRSLSLQSSSANSFRRYGFAVIKRTKFLSPSLQLFDYHSSNRQRDKIVFPSGKEVLQDIQAAGSAVIVGEVDLRRSYCSFHVIR